MFVIGALILPSLSSAQQDTTQSWSLPVKDGLICFDFSKQFENKKRELCSYYTDTKLLQEVNSKVAADLSSKGDKVLSNTNYTMICQLFGADMNASNLQSAFPKCDPSKNDTVWGKLTIMITKNTMSLIAPGGTKASFNTITCNFRVIFIGSSKYEISYRGFTISALTQGGVTQQPLEDTYNEFVKAEKKKKSEKEFFQDIKELIELFNTALGEQLERNIKIAELN